MERKGLGAVALQRILVSLVEGTVTRILSVLVTWSVDITTVGTFTRMQAQHMTAASNLKVEQICFAHPCTPLVVDGGWSAWAAWSTCTKTRARQCTNPVPDNGGAACSGKTEEVVPCS